MIRFIASDNGLMRMRFGMCMPKAALPLLRSPFCR